MADVNRAIKGPLWVVGGPRILILQEAAATEILLSAGSGPAPPGPGRGRDPEWKHMSPDKVKSAVTVDRDHKNHIFVHLCYFVYFYFSTYEMPIKNSALG